MGALSLSPLPMFFVFPSSSEQAETSWQSAWNRKRKGWQSGHSGSNNLPGELVPISLSPCSEKISWIKAFQAGNRQTRFFLFFFPFVYLVWDFSRNLPPCHFFFHWFLKIIFVRICTIRNTYKKRGRRNRWRQIVLERRWKAE